MLTLAERLVLVNRYEDPRTYRAADRRRLLLKV